MAREFKIPENPTPTELIRLLSICSNQIARLSDTVATYKSEVAIKITINKRANAKAKIKYKNSGTVDIVKALVELDEEVNRSTDDLDTAIATYELAKAELDSYEAYFTALRKIAEVRKAEIRGGVG